MIPQAVHHLISTARDASSREADLRAAAASLLQAVAGAPLAEVNAVLSELAGCLSLDDPARAAFIALVGGALVEHDGDPAPLAQPLNPRLQSLLEASAQMVDACLARMGQAEDGSGTTTEPFENVRQQAARVTPRD